jgi:N6-adenosine-specific RNA methylase IME4
MTTKKTTAIAASKPYELTPTGIIWHRKATPEEWTDLINWLNVAQSAVHWWVGDALLYGDEHLKQIADQVVDASKWEESTVRVYKSVCARVPPANRHEKVPFGHYVNGIAALPVEKQTEWVYRVAEDSLSQAQMRTELRLSARREHYAAGDLPDGKFRVLYVDPPWAYDDSGVILEESAYGRAERHYPTMTIEQLMAMPVIDHVEDDAVMFMWVTAPLLMERPGPREVIEAWGFKPKTGMVWHKDAHNFGHYVSVRHEHLLICTRGSCTPDQPTPMPSSVYTEKRKAHSQKPDYFRELIARLYPIGRRLELFGREEHEGWTVYGNQIGTAVVSE